MFSKRNEIFINSVEIVYNFLFWFLLKLQKMQTVQNNKNCVLSINKQASLNRYNHELKLIFINYVDNKISVFGFDLHNHLSK